MSDLGAGFGLLNPAGYANASDGGGIASYSELGTPWAQLLIDDMSPSGDPTDLDRWNDSSGSDHQFDWSDGQAWTPALDSDNSPVAGDRVCHFQNVPDYDAAGYLGAEGDFQWPTVSVGIAFRMDSIQDARIFCMTNRYSRGFALWIKSASDWGVYADLRTPAAGATNVYYPSSETLVVDNWYRLWFKKKASGLSIFLDGVELSLGTTVINDLDGVGIDETSWIDRLTLATRVNAVSLGSWNEGDATPNPTFGMTGQIGEVVIWNSELTDEQFAAGDALMAQRLELS